MNEKEIDARLSVLESKVNILEPFSKKTRIIYTAILIIQLIILFILLKR